MGDRRFYINWFMGYRRFYINWFMGESNTSVAEDVDSTDLWMTEDVE